MIAHRYKPNEDPAKQILGQYPCKTCGLLLAAECHDPAKRQEAPVRTSPGNAAADRLIDWSLQLRARSRALATASQHLIARLTADGETEEAIDAALTKLRRAFDDPTRYTEETEEELKKLMEVDQ